MSSAWPSAGVSTTTGAPAAAQTATSASGSMVPSAMLACRSRAGAELVAGVVQVHQVDPAGDRLRPVDHVDEVLTGGEGVAGVQAEPDAELADRVPEPGQRVEVAGHRVVPAGGVLDEHRHREAALVLLALDELAPVVHPGAESSPAVTWPPCTTSPSAPTSAAAVGVLHHQLAARDPDPVVGRGHVDHVRRVHLRPAMPRRPAAARPGGARRLLPALRVGQEHLHDLGAALGRRGDRSSSRTWAPMSTAVKRQ